MPRAGRTAPSDAPPDATGPALVPSLLLGHGHLCLPGPEGPVEARESTGEAYDILEVADRLAARYHQLYVVDLEGIEHNVPQLDYLQEIARDAEVWIDAGVRTSDQSIDVIVAGGRRAVLSSAYLRGARELRRAWRLSPDLVFELELVDGRLHAAAPEWRDRPVPEVAAEVRALGLRDLVLSPRGTEVDWALVRELSASGPVWVDGSFDRSDAPRLREAGAAGGIFHIADELAEMAPPGVS